MKRKKSIVGDWSLSSWRGGEGIGLRAARDLFIHQIKRKRREIAKAQVRLKRRRRARIVCQVSIYTPRRVLSSQLTLKEMEDKETNLFFFFFAIVIF